MAIVIGIIMSFLLTVAACWLVIKLDKKERTVFNKSKVRYFDGDNT